MERRIRILDRHDATIAYAPIKKAKRKLYLKQYYSENKEAQLERNRKPEYQAKQKEYLRGYLKEYMKKYRPEYRRRKKEETIPGYVYTGKKGRPDKAELAERARRAAEQAQKEAERQKEAAERAQKDDQGQTPDPNTAN